MSYKKVFVIIASLLLILIAFFYFQQSTPTNGTSDEEKKGFFSFLPFGNNSSNNIPSNGVTQNSNGEGGTGTTNPLVVPRLRQISNVPTAGYISFQRKSSTTDFFNGSLRKSTSTPTTTPTMTVIRFIERATGHIYETISTTYTSERVSNQTISKIYSALFERSGNNFIAQTLTSDSDVIDSFIEVAVATSTSEKNIPVITQFVQELLPDGLLQLTTSPNKNSLFYLEQNSNGSVGYTSSILNSKPSQVFSSPLKEWSVLWPKEDTLVFTTKASSYSAGLSQFITLKPAKITTVLKNIQGLTTLTNGDLSQILYSESAQNSLNFYNYNVKSTQKEILTIKTLPEKCVWSKRNTSIAYCAVPENIPSGQYPENWYQGVISFNDNLWKLNFATKEYTLLLRPQNEGRVSIDMIHPTLSETEEFIYFINKKDLTLWSYQIEE